MGLHHCPESDCPEFGKPSARHCGCHQSDEAVLRERVGRLETELDKAASRFEHCANMIAAGFGISGTLRAEMGLKAQHYALETRAAITQSNPGDL